MSEIAELWNEHSKRRFPRGLGGAEIDGIDLVELDDALHTCLSIAAMADGRLDGGRLELLRKCFQNLPKVTSELKGDAHVYFGGLERMACIVLESNGWKRKKSGRP